MLGPSSEEYHQTTPLLQELLLLLEELELEELELEELELLFELDE